MVMSSSSAAAAAAAAAPLQSHCNGDPAAMEILDVCYIKPLQPTQRFLLRLSYGDSVFAGCAYRRCVLFFSHLPGALDMAALKHGLSAALVPFYPLAGRLHCADDDSTSCTASAGGPPLSIDCSDAGVEFVEAVTDLDFADLQRKHFPVRHSFARFLTRQEAPPDPPLLSIQATRFRGGEGTGVAIGVAVDHVAADGHSLFHFLKSWGECCRGQAVSLPPLHIRSLNEPESWGFEKYSRQRFSIADLGLPAPPPSPPPQVQSSPGAMYCCKVMHFDSSACQQLKQTAMAESGNPRISKFQAVLACVWKRICAAQNLPSHKEVRMYLRGNQRNLILPSMTDAYFGNALQIVSTSATAGELQRESLGAMAARINECLQLLKDQAHLRREIQALEKNLHAFFRKMADGSERDVLPLSVAGGPQMPVYEVDMGMGRPAAVRPAMTDSAGQYDLVVFGGREEGSMDIFVQFPSQRDLDAVLSTPCPCMDI